MTLPQILSIAAWITCLWHRFSSGAWRNEKSRCPKLGQNRAITAMRRLTVHQSANWQSRQPDFPGRFWVVQFQRLENEKAAETAAFVCLILGEEMERVRRFERPTPTLARLCSTPELHPLARPWAASRAYMAEERGDCNREMTVFLERISSRGDVRIESIEPAPKRTDRKSRRQSRFPGSAPAALPRWHGWP